MLRGPHVQSVLIFNKSGSLCFKTHINLGARFIIFLKWAAAAPHFNKPINNRSNKNIGV